MAAEGGQVRYPEKLEVPRRKITPGEITARIEGHSDRVRVDVLSDGSPVGVAEGFAVSGQNGQGDAYVYWDGVTEGLNGTYMEPEALFEVLEPNMVAREARVLLLGGAEPWRDPLVRLRSADGLMRVNVFAGASCRPAQLMSQVGDAGVLGQAERMAFQTALARVYEPVALRLRQSTREALELTSYDRLLVDVEDVGATGDTVAGVSRVVSGLDKWSVFGGRRVDLANTTAQSLVMMWAEAKRVGLPVEVNTGYMGWGLTEGVGPDLQHKNYIAHAPLLELQTTYSDRVQVVGDVGSAAQRVVGLPWEVYRRDEWGIHGPDDATEYTYVMDVDKFGDLSVGYANGSLVMMAIADHYRAGMGLKNSGPRIMAVGKRLDSPERGFALRLNGFVEPFLKYCASR